MISLLLSAQLALVETQAARTCDSPIEIVGATLFVEDTPVVRHFSLWQTRFAFLYLYLPGRGLITVSNRPFDGAERTGQFRGSSLVFSAGDSTLHLESATAILGTDSCDAWVRHEPNYHLNIQGPLYGYGDDPSVAEQWRQQFGTSGG